MNTNKRGTTALLTALTATLLANAAMTAATANGVTELEQVIVTAQKRSENLQDVPIAVTALDANLMKDAGVGNTVDLQQMVPGLVINATGPSAQPYLRGVGTRLAVSGLESSVAIYNDDRYVSRTSSVLLDFADIERVEVLKGPQGILYGRNATGGAIRIISHEVTDELEGSVTVGAGNYNYYTVSGHANIPLNERFAMRFSGITKQRDGFVDNIAAGGNSEWDDRDFSAVRGKFKWNVTDSLTAKLTLDYWHRDDTEGTQSTDLSAPDGRSVGVAVGGLAAINEDEVASLMDKKNDGGEFSSQLRLEAELAGFEFVSVTTYSDLDLDRINEVDGTSARASDVYVFDKEQDFSQEFELVSNTAGQWDWLVGAYFFSGDSDFDLLIDLLTPVAGPFQAQQGRQRVDTTAAALFGQTTWRFSDSWALKLGARYSYEKKEVEVGGSNHNPAAVPLTAPSANEESWEEFTPQITLQRDLDLGLVYLTYARGFKSGGFNYPQSSAPVLEPEILDMYEIGFKGDLLGNKLRLSTSLFYYDYSDLQVARGPAAGSASARIENAANAKVQGLDADLTWMASDRMLLTAGISVLDTEYQDYNAAAKVFNSVLRANPLVPGMSDVSFDADGKPLLRAPDWSGFISLRYEFPVGDGNIPAAITYSYTDDYDFDFIAHPSSDELRQDAYGLLNARLSYVAPNERWSVSLWGDNLTDEEYFVDVVAAGVGLRGTYAHPRTYGVDVSFNF